jgi:hypothetical protein
VRAAAMSAAGDGPIRAVSPDIQAPSGSSEYTGS